MTNGRDDVVLPDWQALERLPKPIREYLYMSPFRWSSAVVLQGYKVMLATYPKSAVAATLGWIKAQEAMRLKAEATRVWNGLPDVSPIVTEGPPVRPSRRAGWGPK